MAALRSLLYVCLVYISLVAGALSPKSSKATSSSFPSLLNATLDDLQDGLEAGLFTSVDLTKTYMARIEEVNDVLHPVTEVNPDALEIAAMLDAQRANGTVLGPLHGIPALLKDNVATADRTNTTSGSWALVNATVPRDSTVARKLREAGAILLGKANMSQWANMRSLHYAHGWSAYGGQVYGAYHPFQDPHGSSSGSAVAVDLGLAALAIGTETDGSITMPSHRNGIVGIKPTVGLVSRDLVIPISEKQDTVGPMTATVRDGAQVLQILDGKDPKDNYTSAIPPGKKDYVAACRLDALKGARLGVPWNAIEAIMQREEGLQYEFDTFLGALEVMKAAGAEVVDANFTMVEEQLADDGESVVLNADFLVNLAEYLSQLTSNPNNVKTLRDIQTFTREHKIEDWPNRDDDVWVGAIDDQGWNNTDPRYWPVYQRNLHLTGPGGLLGALDRHALDAVILPTSVSKIWAALPGSPIVSVPMGFHPANANLTWNMRNDMVLTGPGVPFGLAFLGRHWSEEGLIGLAYGFEQRTKVRGGMRRIMRPHTELGQ